MNDEQYAGMGAGPDMDRIVADAVMGGEVHLYSRSVSSAWLLVRRLTDRGESDGPGAAELVLVQDETSACRSRWWARLDGVRDAPLGIEDGWSCASDHGDGTAPALAICRAALRYVGEKRD